MSKLPFQGYPLRCNIPETYFYVARLLGANGAALTAEEPDLSQGVTHARTDEGVYTMTWATNPGRFIGIMGFCFGAATMADVDDYQLARDTWDASGFVLTYTVYAVTTAADLIADQYLDICVAFTRSGTGL